MKDLTKTHNIISSVIEELSVRLINQEQELNLLGAISMLVDTMVEDADNAIEKSNVKLTKKINRYFSTCQECSKDHVCAGTDKDKKTVISIKKTVENTGFMSVYVSERLGNLEHAPYLHEVEKYELFVNVDDIDDVVKKVNEWENDSIRD